MVEQDKNSPESTGEPLLRRAIELISSLISLSHSSKVFTAKWQSIRNKLDELNSGLFAAENCNSGACASLSGVISDVIDTCVSCRDLANRCVNFRYSGKLLMQSDIDVIAAKFDHHVTDLSKIVTSGILTVSNAIVVVKPGLGACRDDVRFYLNDLLTRLKIGDLEMKVRSLIALNEFIIEDDKYVKICIEIDGFVSVVVSFLDSHDVDLQEESAKFVSVMSKFDVYKHVLIGYGIVWKLIRVLECGSESGKEISTRCLQKLTLNSDNAWSVSAHGGVTALLKVCTRDENSSGELIGLACGVLKNIVGVEEIKRFMVDEGAISTIVNLAGSKNELSQTNSIELLHAMVFDDESIRQMAINEGGIRVLVRVFNPKTTISLKTREVAFKAIDHICFSSTSGSTISVLMGYGFLDHLLYFLRHGEAGVQELALKAAFRLCGLSDELKKTMGDSGFMPEFVKLLDAKSYQVREMAAEALYNMALMSRNQRKFLQEEPNIVMLLQLLGPEDHVNNSGVTRKFVLSTLLLLTNCSSGRRKIVNSGYMKNMEKLAEADVSDAKRIVRKLSTNTFRSILKGIWHS